MNHRLSKSRIMSSLQCRRRVHLEIHRPELACHSGATEAAFALGHAVGELAMKLYGHGAGHFVAWEGGDFTAALHETREWMASPPAAPIFEATLQHEGVLVREDVLLPQKTAGRDSWRIIEVKASTKVKPEHGRDCAIQAWVHLESGQPLAGISLAHVDNRFVYPGGGDYRGLLIEEDLTEQVLALLPSVPLWVREARAAVDGALPEVPVGQHCAQPYPCPFTRFCWPQDAQYPIAGLGGDKNQLGRWVARGYRDLREVPAEEISDETRLRIRRVTRAGRAERLPGARAFIEALPWPRYCLDFETIAPAIPLWAGTRPYQTLPFQWSCHIERAAGEFEHAEFLDLSGQPPMRALAESLVDTLQSKGQVLMYTSYERRVIRDLASMFPDLAPALAAIDARLIDLHPVTRANYYHPDMLGSWSIKAVLPTIAPDLDYRLLEGIHEGTEASAAYLEAIDPRCSPERKRQLREDLLKYCRHDTEAMVRLTQFFARE